ncbi:MAG: PKD domain-containing protein [Flavobacteriales bacterium]
MKKFFTLRAASSWSRSMFLFVGLVSLSAYSPDANAQTFSATASSGAINVAIPDNDQVTGVSSQLVLSGGIGNVGPNTKVSVTLNITHTFDGDLDIFLVGPAGCGTLELTTGNGGTNEDYTNTVLASPNGGGSITGGTAPYTGTFSPEGAMTGTQVVAPYALSTNSITGCPVNGTWTLRIFDAAAVDIGTLVDWSLTIATADKLVAWQMSMPVTNGDEVSLAATTLRTGLNASTLTRGSGIVAAALVRTFNSSGFNTAPNTEAAAITSGDYCQFTVGASAGNQVSLSTLDVRLRRSGTGPNTYQWRYSLDGTNFTDIGGDVTYNLTTGTGDDQTQVALSGVGALQNVGAGTTITLRIYAFGATNAGGLFGVGRFAAGNSDYSLSVGGSVIPTSPVLAPTTPTGFGNVCINTTGGPNTFTINGTFLSAANVTVGALSGFEYSYQGAGGPYTPSLSLTQPGGTYSQVIHVRFNPTLVQSYDGNIAVGGGGASSVNVAVTGSGVNTVPTLTSGAASAISTNDATVAGAINSTGCSAYTSYGIEYSTTNGFVNGTGTQVPSTNIGGGNYTSALTGLLSCTTYYYKAYAVSNAGTGYGTQGSFTTAAPVAPSPLAANPISYNSFTANWITAAGAASYQLDVSTSPTFIAPGAATMVQWNFPINPDDAIADGGITANLARTITTGGGTNAVVFTAAGATTRCAATDAWDGGSGVKYWQVDLSTQGYAGMTVSSKQISSGTGPRDWRLEYRIGTGGAWTIVTGGSITVLNDGWVSGVLSNVALPSACDDQPSLFLRWIITSDIRVNGGTPIQNAGTSRIDDIIISATNVPFLLTGYDPIGVGGTSQGVTGLSPNTTYYYRVRSVGDGGCVSGNSTGTAVATTAVPIYYSRATGNVTDPIWSDTPAGVAGSATFTSNSSMVVQSPDVVTNTANATVKDLSVDAGGTLVLNASTILDVKGSAATINGTITANDNSTFSITEATASTLAIAGTASFFDLTAAPATSLTVTGGADIRGTLQLTDGVFNATGATVTLRSTATYAGRLGPVAATASYTGNLKVERYIPGGATNWRLLGSPVAGATVNGWQDDFFTAGYPGSQYPNFYDPPGSGIFWPSIRWYDEPNGGPLVNDGLVGVSSNAQALSQGQGFAAWSGDNLGGTAPFMTELTGNPHVANTPIVLPVTYTNTGVGNTDGWNLVSNPVASPILFNSIVRNGSVADFVTYYNPAAGNTAVYDISLNSGTNGATNVIQSSQGFFVKTTGTAPSATVNEAAKTAGNGGGFFGGDEETVSGALHLKVTSAINEYNDETVVVFSAGTPAVDGEDALKYIFAIPAAPQIATIGGNNELIAINAYGAYTTAISIPVMVDAGVSGTYTVTATGIETLGLTCLSIEDLLTGSVTPLIEGATYSFEMDAAADAGVPRLVLHATAPLAFAATDATCGGMANGQATVTVSEGPQDVSWTDGVGTVLLQQNAITGDATFGGLAAGTYAVHVGTSGVCGELVNEFTIDAPFVLEGATVGNTPTTCADTEDGSVDVLVMGGVEPYTYAWSNGADTEDLTAGAGTYTLTVTDANNCEWSSDVYTIDAGGAVAGFTVENSNVLVNADVLFTNTSTPDAEYFWEFGDGDTSASVDPIHAYAMPGVYTVTLTVTSGDCIAVTAFDVTVEMNTGISTGQTAGLSAWTSANGFVVEHNFNQRVLIEVLDATGRLQATRQVAGTPGRVILSTEGLSTGIWFVRVTSGGTQQTFRLPLLR